MFFLALDIHHDQKTAKNCARRNLWAMLGQGRVLASFFPDSLAIDTHGTVLSFMQQVGDVQVLLPQMLAGAFNDPF
jgi:hypothetical protein